MYIEQRFATNSDCYKAQRFIVPKGIMIHSVGCPQPECDPFYNNWNKPGQKACTHAVADNKGRVLQLLPWNMRAWHCGSGENGSGNNNFISVELTEPNSIKYIGGANWVETGDGTNTASHVLGTYKTAVELFAFLCNQYKLNPLSDGVIISHHEGHLRGIASNHGDVEHLWNKFGLSTTVFRQDIYNMMKQEGYSIETTQSEVVNMTNIMGKSQATIEQAKSLLRKNRVAENYVELVDIYFEEGEKEGVRGDIALSQSIVETGWYTFKGDVVPEQNNFAGLGTTGGGVKGCYFATPREGIRAQIQHLKAYASTEPLNGECVDPRFNLVQRGVAPYVEYLGIQENPLHAGWAAGKDYGSKVLNILNSMLAESVNTQQSESQGTTESSASAPTPSPVSTQTPTAKYVARLKFDDPTTQIGCYNQLNNAILKIEEVTPYKIFSSESGEVIYESAYAKLGRPKAFKVEVEKEIVARVEPFGTQATLLKSGEYEIVITYSHWGLILGIGWVDLAEVKIKSTIIKNEEKTEDNSDLVSFTDKEGTQTKFTQKEWDKLIKLWAYTGAAEEFVGHHTVQELRTILTTI